MKKNTQTKITDKDIKRSNNFELYQERRRLYLSAYKTFLQNIQNKEPLDMLDDQAEEFSTAIWRYFTLQNQGDNLSFLEKMNIYLGFYDET